MDKDPLDGFYNTFTAIAVRHIDNDQGLLATMHEALASFPDAIDSGDEAMLLLEEQMDDFLAKVSHEEPRSLFFDLMQSAFYQVHWHEIAAYYRRRLEEGREQ